jgi:hypothetical protein
MKYVRTNNYSILFFVTVEKYLLLFLLMCDIKIIIFFASCYGFFLFNYDVGYDIV